MFIASIADIAIARRTNLVFITELLLSRSLQVANRLLIVDLRLLPNLLARIFHSLHHLGMKRPLDALFFGLVEEFGMQEVAALFLRLDLFGWNPVSVCPQVL